MIRQEGGIAQWEAQTHIVAALKANASITERATGIFDHAAPPDQPYPYVVMGDWTETNEDLLSIIGSQVTVTLHVWSFYQGGLEVKAIANDIAKELSHRSFSTENWHFPVVRLEHMHDLVQPDECHHLVMRFRLIAEKRS